MNKASFTWDSSQSPKLIEIYLNVNAGSLVGIIGAIGSCKSSLLAAILGEMSLIDGSITHHVQFLPEFDHCILLHHGKIERQGLFSELLKIDKVKQAYEKHQTHSEENSQRSDSNVYDDDDDFMNPIEIIDKSSIVREETSINGTISGDVWLKLFTSSVYDVTNKWLSLWSSKSEVKQREKHYPNIYLGLLICTLILALLRADYFFHVILRGASVLHNNMFKGVLYSSLRFHESNPVGRILNRFSKDQQILDESLPLTFFDTIQLLIMVLGSIVIIGMANPWVYMMQSCCLITDLQSFPAGDSTVIGEKGVNLSGGQKARVSLARALYTEADIYLFDDPLAAVDPTIARKIFQQCISNQGILNDKTRLLVTHQIQFLPEFDHCILLDHGKIEKQGIYDATNKWLSIWSSKLEVEQRESHYLYVYLGLVIGTWLMAIIRADYFFHIILRGASVFHDCMLKGVLYSSLRFYESNPVGRILNRFSKDQQVIDELLPVTFFDTIQSLTMVLGSIVIIGISNPWALLILIIIIPMLLWLRRIYVRTSREIKRLESVSRSPIYALFSSSLSGLMTIRTFEVENHFLNSFIYKNNTNTRALFIFIALTRWFGLRLDLMTCSITFLTAILSITLRQNMDASSVALGLAYAINLLDLFQGGVRQSAATENYMISTERIDEYSHIPPESGFYKEELEKPSNWPTEGRIEFDDYKLSYRPELEPVLKGINLKIEPRNKIGIIGRTGAGKSSIFQALYRFTDKSITHGKILIDGIDISKISLNDLRSNLNIIPQSPVLFSNTLRYNLDPFNHYTDEQLWDVLEAVQLKRKIENLKDKLSTQIAEYGSNFSVGECQLICVARAILKPSKILLIDEATAHVDTKTDELIQKILREKFMNHTVLTIAHRLHTVIDSDKIVIMNDGIVAKYGTPQELFNEKNEILTDMNNDNEPVTYL
ncbi:unnamed protein product [Rotaria sp. Silwood1]|nr:unnamed protein product [Rotaria sp. Silwood1]